MIFFQVPPLGVCLSSPLLCYCCLVIKSVQQRLPHPLGPFPAINDAWLHPPAPPSASWTLFVPSMLLLDPFLPSMMLSYVLLHHQMPPGLFPPSQALLCHQAMLGYALLHHQMPPGPLTGPFPPFQTLPCHR